jgi:hypothetical protein
VPTILATVDTDLAVVLLEGEADPGETSVIIERVIVATGATTVLTGAAVPTLGNPPLYRLYDSTPPLDTEILYRVTSLPGGGTAETAPLTVPSNGFVWFKDPARPWANLRLDLCDPAYPFACATELESCASLLAWGGEVRQVDATLFPILARERPVDVYSRRKDVVGSVRFASRTCECIDDIYTLFTAGGPLFIQLPAVYCVLDRYYQPGDLEMIYIHPDQRVPLRVWDVALTAVDQPVGPTQGVAGATWCDVAEAYGTYADLTAAGLTWADIIEGSDTPAADGYGDGLYGDGPYGDGG